MPEMPKERRAWKAAGRIALGTCSLGSDFSPVEGLKFVFLVGQI
jgi:hypothetical protein